MKGYLFLLLTLCVVSATMARQITVGDKRGNLFGTVTDSVTRARMPFVSVSLQTGAEIVGGALTDSTGGFHFHNLEFGTYRVTFTAVGYKSFQSGFLTLSPETPLMDVGTVTLSPEISVLETVTIRGQRPLIEQRADGIVFNTESLASSAGIDAADLLRKVPMLAVDGNGGLSLRGRSNIRVFIDGKPSEAYASSIADALRSIPAGNIVKVEVITHPSARYDAEGTEGVVNIFTRKKYDNGTSGNVSIVPGNRSQVLMGDMYLKYRKWLVKCDGFVQSYRNRNGSELERRSEELRFLQKNETVQTGSFMVGGVNIMYSLDSNRIFNAGYRARSMPSGTQSISDNLQFAGETFMPVFQRAINTRTGYHGNIFTAGYTSTSTDKRREISLQTVWSFANLRNRYDLLQTDPMEKRYEEKFDSRGLNDELIVQADFGHTLPRNGKLEYGGKFYERGIDSDNRFSIAGAGSGPYRNDARRSNTFSYRSSVYALYANTNFQWSNWRFITGVRYESTLLKGTLRGDPIEIEPFHNIMPNILVSRSVGRKGMLKAGYSVKLVRPQLNLLNPTVNDSDSLNVQKGNPHLVPEITRRYQLNYSQNSEKLFTDIELFYNRNRNSIELIRTPIEAGVFESSWQNVGRNRRLGASVSLTWKPASATSLNATITSQHVKLASPVRQLHNAGFMHRLVINYSQKLKKGFSFDFYGFFDGHNLQLQGRRTGWKYYSLSISKKSKGERFNLSLRMDTPLTRHTFIKETIQTDSFRQELTSRYQNQNIRLICAVRLGKKEIKSPPRREAVVPE